MIATTGTLRYSPEIRPGSTTRRDGGSTRWWLIVDADPELGRYLRHLYTISEHRIRVLQAPLWGPHVSVIRGEEPAASDAWGALDGATVEFRYDPLARETDGYVWCPVDCDAVLDLREQLGLTREPNPSLHLTIGNARYAR
ncbi:MAG TPA: hypothetical protein VJ724_06520 [Tahibacter sp.]|nr:hypothetical protein [Tahibacter sp.]